MRKLFIIVFTFISLVANAQFRNTTWGMSLNEVKNIEKEKLMTGRGGALLYNFVIEDMDCMLTYSFNDKDQLISITYMFTRSGKLAYEIFPTTVKNITSKYGQPTEAREGYSSWSTDKFSIRAMSDGSITTKVIYSPPAPSLKDIL